MALQCLASTFDNIEFPPLQTSFAQLNENPANSRVTMKFANNVADAWEKHNIRTFAHLMLQYQIASAQDSPLILWEWSMWDENYRCIMISGKTAIFLQWDLKKWDLVKVPVSEQDIISIVLLAAKLSNYQGNAEKNGFDIPIYFCSVWQQNKAINCFIVYYIDRILNNISCQRPPHPDDTAFCRHIRNAAMALDSSRALIGIGNAGTPYHHDCPYKRVFKETDK